MSLSHNASNSARVSLIEDRHILDFPHPLLPIRPYRVPLLSRTLALVKISRSPTVMSTSQRSISLALVTLGSNLVCWDVAVII